MMYIFFLIVASMPTDCLVSLCVGCAHFTGALAFAIMSRAKMAELMGDLIVLLCISMFIYPSYFCIQDGIGSVL